MRTRWSESSNAHTARGVRMSGAKVAKATENVADTGAVAMASATSMTATGMTTKTDTANVVESKERDVIPAIAGAKPVRGADAPLSFLN